MTIPTSFSVLKTSWFIKAKINPTIIKVKTNFNILNLYLTPKNKIMNANIIVKQLLLANRIPVSSEIKQINILKQQLSYLLLKDKFSLLFLKRS